MATWGGMFYMFHTKIMCLSKYYVVVFLYQCSTSNCMVVPIKANMQNVLAE
jgi:hypothetical protein